MGMERAISRFIAAEPTPAIQTPFSYFVRRIAQLWQLDLDLMGISLCVATLTVMELQMLLYFDAVRQ
jgi:hypothetical protein